MSAFCRGKEPPRKFRDLPHPRPLAAGVAVLLLLLMVGCFALGYGSAHIGVAQRSPDRSAIRLDLARPEGRALIDRVGVRSGRLSMLESEAATLAHADVPSGLP